MKLVIDEKLKHRLIGLAVIISLGAIFAPAIMKKSSQNFESNYSVHVKLPSKPIAPDVALSDEKELFKTIKIAKVELPKVSAESQVSELARAQVISSDTIAVHEAPSLDKKESVLNPEPIKLAVNQAAKNTAKQIVQVASNKSTKPIVKPVPATKSPAVVAVHKKPVVKAVKLAANTARKPQAKPNQVKSEVYAVQLASFAQLSNAQALVNKLHQKGYKATFAKVSTRQGAIYKVYAGHSTNKVQVLRMKTQLSSAMQLNGFIVNTGVS